MMDIVFLVINSFAAEIFCKRLVVDTAERDITVDTTIPAALIRKSSKGGRTTAIG
jgi:hypothetical protein